MHKSSWILSSYKKERPARTMGPLPNTMDMFKISPQVEPGHLPLRATLWEMSADKQAATNLYHDRCFPVIYLEHRDPIKTPKYKILHIIQGIHKMMYYLKQSHDKYWLALLIQTTSCHPHELGFDDGFLDRIPNAWTTKHKMDTLGFVKLKTLCIKGHH